MKHALPTIFTLAFLLCLTSCARHEPGPLQARLLKDVGYFQNSSHRTVSADILRKKLARYGETVVLDGDYILPKVWEMPFAEWCSPHGTDPLPPGDCQTTSDWAAQKMEGYAFGIAWNDTHMLNIAVLDLDNEIRLAHYEPQTCHFTVLDNVKGVIID